MRPGGVLFLYGPYKEGGVHTAPTNEAFDASLRARNPEWGVRDLDDVKALAARHGLEFVERIAMPRTISAWCFGGGDDRFHRNSFSGASVMAGM